MIHGDIDDNGYILLMMLTQYLYFFQETLLASKMTSVEDGVYKCHHHRSDHHHNHHHRKRRYAVSPFKFHTMVVLWHVVNFSTKLPKDVQLSVFKEAFDKWHDVSRLNFSYTANVTKAHIKISFLKGTVVYCTCSNCWIVSEA